jgi:AraC-like DNA-binding protein
MTRTSTTEAYERATTAVVSRMRERPGEPLDLAGMAAIAGLSRSHFDRVFRSVTGLSPRRFQTALRLQAATRLLLTTHRSVTDVCFEVGYQSLGTFVSCFTRNLGVSPARLRAFGVGGPPAPRLIFIGLFNEPLPTTTPVACAILAKPGPFTIDNVPRGAHYALAVGISWCEHPLELLMTEHALRGIASDVVRAPCRGVTITLRPSRATDPPINFALPFLMVQEMR